MPQISEVARFTGGKAAPADIDTPEGQAWLVWNAMNNAKGSTDFPRQGTPGISVRINVRDVCHSLWPTLHRDDLTQRAADVRAYFRQTGNAACLFPQGDGSSKVPVWWVAREWTSGARTVVLVHRETPRERKLTAAEAGEDREPAPVTVTRKDETTQTPEETPVVTADVLEAEAPTTEPEVTETEAQKARAALMAVVNDFAQPWTRVEWCLAAGISLAEDKSKTPGQQNIHRWAADVMRELIREGAVFTRMETRDERRVRFGMGADGPAPRARGSLLHWTSALVPERTLRSVVPGHEAVQKIPTVEEMRATTKKSYDDALNRCLTYLEKLDREAYVTVRVLARETEVPHNRMKWVVGELLGAQLIQVKREKRTQGDFFAARIRLAGTRNPSPVDVFSLPPDLHVTTKPVEPLSAPETAPEPVVEPDAPVTLDAPVKLREPAPLPVDPAELDAMLARRPAARLPLEKIAADGSFMGRIRALLDEELETRLERRVASAVAEHVGEKDARIAELEKQNAKLKRALAAYLE